MACGADVEVDVAVAEVAEAAGDDAGEGTLHLLLRVEDEARHVRDGDRNVVGEGLALGALRLRDGIADFPEGLGLGFVCGDRRVGDDALVERGDEKPLDFGAETGFRVRRRLDQHVPGMVGGERGARAGNVPQHELERVLRHQLEAFDIVGARLEEAQQVERLRRAGDPCPGDRARRDRRHQTQRGRGDHAQGTLGADQQLVEAVAAVVLLESGEAAVDRAVREHRLDAGDERAHRPELQHLRAAGVGRGEPADGAAAARAERQGEAHADIMRRLVQRREDHAGFGDSDSVFRADRADAVHPPH